jgi:uncharacterized membrane protein YcaP (DUF421 family)
MFFDSWSDLLRILVVGASAYIGLVAMLRVSGKRTLAKMNAFDLVVTVALGSTLATVLLTKDVSLAEGLLAFGLLCGLQFIIAFISVRWPRFQHIIKAEPSLLYFRGDFLGDAMRKERVSEEEVFAALRSQGALNLTDAEAVVLETDGSFSVLKAGSSEGTTTMRHVQRGSSFR